MDWALNNLQKLICHKTLPTSSAVTISEGIFDGQHAELKKK